MVAIMPPAIRLHATDKALMLEQEGRFVTAPASFTLAALSTAADPVAAAATAFAAGSPAIAPESTTLRAPIGSQEIWAAGVTYLRSKTARMEESKDAGG